MALRCTFTNLTGTGGGTRILITGISATLKFWGTTQITGNFEGIPLRWFQNWIGTNGAESGSGGQIDFPPIRDCQGNAIPYNMSISLNTQAIVTLQQVFDDPELADDSRQSNAGRRIA
jgi:hypothetical protein